MKSTKKTENKDTVSQDFIKLLKDADINSVLNEEDIQKFSDKLLIALEAKYTDGYNTALEYFKKHFETKLDKFKEETNTSINKNLAKFYAVTEEKICDIVDFVGDIKTQYSLTKENINKKYKMAFESSISKLQEENLINFKKAISKYKDSITNEQAIKKIDKLINNYVSDLIDVNTVALEEENKRLKNFYTMVQESVIVNNEILSSRLNDEKKKIKLESNQFKEKFLNETKILKEEIEKISSQLDEEIDSKNVLNNKLNKLKCEHFLLSATKDLPDYQKMRIESLIGKNKYDYKFITENINKLIKKIHRDDAILTTEDNNSMTSAPSIPEIEQPVSEMDEYVRILNGRRRKK